MFDLETNSEIEGLHLAKSDSASGDGLLVPQTWVVDIGECVSEIDAQTEVEEASYARCSTPELMGWHRKDS